MGDNQVFLLVHRRFVSCFKNCTKYLLFVRMHNSISLIEKPQMLC